MPFGESLGASFGAVLLLGRSFRRLISFFARPGLVFPGAAPPRWDSVPGLVDVFLETDLGFEAGTFGGSAIGGSDLGAGAGGVEGKGGGGAGAGAGGVARAASRAANLFTNCSSCAACCVACLAATRCLTLWPNASDSALEIALSAKRAGCWGAGALGGAPNASGGA